MSTADERRAHRRQFLEATGWFDATWYSRVADVPPGVDPLDHWLDVGAAAGLGPNAAIDVLSRPGVLDLPPVQEEPPTADPSARMPLDEAQVLAAEIALLHGTGHFDDRYYLASNDDVARSGIVPVSHFAQYGWRELRRPSAEFDVWWYWTNHLDPGGYSINPLVHYALVGEAAGLSTAPLTTRPATETHLPSDRAVRRVCLFAGYDRDGVVDDSVVAYVTELSRFADVYYLADCHLDASELAKLSGVTKGAWGMRHRGYDFGSWSMLARDLVGWDTIEEYDELLLVNDSCFLLRPLDELFESMQSRSCDWWGLQATKGISRTKARPSNTFTEKIPLETVKRDLLASYEEESFYDFHVGSYFLAYRGNVIRDRGFRRQLDAVHDQSSKLLIIQKYEIGLTRYLIGNGYSFDTYVPDLHPFHPLFTETHFELIGQGFPLLKKYFIYQNHYDTPDLVRWKDRVTDLVPDASVEMLEMLERCLERTSPHDRLWRSFRITRNARGAVTVPRLMSGEELKEEDGFAPKFDHWWAFPVCGNEHTLTGNERAVFEEVRHDPSVKKVVLTRSRRVDVDGENVVVLPLLSPEGQRQLIRSRQVFVKNSPRVDIPFALSAKTHNFVNLTQGIPLQRFGSAAVAASPAERRTLATRHRGSRAVVTSSRVDSLAIAAALHPLTLDDMWATGLPRHDFVAQAFDRLPADLREQESRLRALVGDRRLVLFAPAPKGAQSDGYYRFDEPELSWLADWCERENVVLGVRGPLADHARTYAAALGSIGALDLPPSRFPDVEAVLRVASSLVTDYSSALVDFLLTGRPVVSFAHEHEGHAQVEQGLLYDLETVLPGPVCRDFDELTKALDVLFETRDDEWRDDYEWKRSLFFDHVDDQNAWRVVKRVKGLYGSSAA